MSSRPERSSDRPRHTVAWMALWQKDGGGTSMRQGIVCDVSPHGMFLRPVGGAPGDLSVNVRVRVVFLVNVGGATKKAESTGIVRWQGRNTGHKCEGFGIEFESVNETLREVAPQLAQECAAAESDVPVSA